MKTIGLLGGMSWESTVQYYRLINEGIRASEGGLHSAQLVLHSVDLAPLAVWMNNGEWQNIETVLVEAARGLERAGAEFFLICTNTMHKLAPAIERSVDIPLLHIADATAETLITQGKQKVGLLGTAFTMEEAFYRGRLESVHDLQVLVPQSQDREVINRVIFDELCCGKILPESKRQYLRIVESLMEAGAEAVVLGCTEIGMLISQDDVSLPLFDTTHLHAAKAVNYALGS